MAKTRTHSGTATRGTEIDIVSPEFLIHPVKLETETRMHAGSSITAELVGSKQ